MSDETLRPLFDPLSPVVTFTYSNHHGNTRRRVIPTGRLVRDEEYHVGVPYLVEAWDLDRWAMRTFDPEFITSWRVEK